MNRRSFLRGLVASVSMVAIGQMRRAPDALEGLEPFEWEGPGLLDCYSMEYDMVLIEEPYAVDLHLFDRMQERLRTRPRAVFVWGDDDHPEPHWLGATTTPRTDPCSKT